MIELAQDFFPEVSSWPQALVYIAIAAAGAWGSYMRFRRELIRSKAALRACVDGIEKGTSEKTSDPTTSKFIKKQIESAANKAGVGEEVRKRQANDVDEPNAS